MGEEFNPFTVDLDEPTTTASTAEEPATADDSTTEQDPTDRTTAGHTGGDTTGDPEAADGSHRGATASGQGVYRLRQARLAVGVAVALAAGMWVHAHGVPGAAPSRSEQVAAAQAAAGDAHRVPGMRQARIDQDQAATWYAVHHSYRGFTVPGARSAGSDTAWVASRVTDNVCLMYAMRGDQRTEVAADPSGTACTDTEMLATATALNADEHQQARADRARTAAAFDQFAQTAQLYASTTWSHGVPSLAGLPPTGLIDGVTVTANHGTWVAVTYRDAAGCATASISTDGTVSEIGTCR